MHALGKERALLAQRKLFPKTFVKPLDICPSFQYNINVAMREWRNWQTRTFEGRVVYTVRVQVPFLAPTSEKSTEWCSFCFRWSKTGQH